MYHCIKFLYVFFLTNKFALQKNEQNTTTEDYQNKSQT